MTPDPVLRAEGLAATYPGTATPALHDVSFEVCSGCVTAVLGPNGGGKTTLFRLITGELAASAGTLHVPPRVGVVPQTDRSRLDFPVSAHDVALMGAVPRLPWWGRPSREDRDAATRALERVGLGDGAERTFGELSGGQRQRVLVARALVQDAPLVLLDEPFSGLDSASAAALMRLLGELAAEGRALLVATHDVEQARSWDLVLCLNGAQVAFGEPEAVLDRAVLERTYGASIVALPGEPGRGVLPAHHHC